MRQPIEELFENNRAWAARMASLHPGFFEKLSAQQAPEYLWIGCSDSRVPANEIAGLWPGEMFVHRNIANVVVHSDLNCISVLQYAVDVLRVQHVIVCGHFGCGGVKAVVQGAKLGLVDNWLRHVQDVALKHSQALEELPDPTAKVDLLCKLNVIEQALNVSQTPIVQDVWERGQPLTIHGWIYGLQDGHLRDLGMRVSGPNDLDGRYPEAVSAACTVPTGAGAD